MNIDTPINAIRTSAIKIKVEFKYCDPIRISINSGMIMIAIAFIIAIIRAKCWPTRTPIAQYKVLSPNGTRRIPTS